MTKVFISWSGEKSRLVGEELRTWLPSVIQSVVPYFTPKDIDKGTKWESDISGELDETNFGIVCLTKQNQHAPWIMYEAGALSKNVENGRLATVLIDLGPADVKGPLTRFQHARFEKTDFRKLMDSVNNACGDRALEAATLSRVFDLFWPQLDEKLKKISAMDFDGTPAEAARSSDDILEEILVRVRRIDSEIKSDSSKNGELKDSNDEEFSVGDIVIHPSRGEGEVVVVRDGGMLTVQFGMKRVRVSSEKIRLK